MATPAEMADYYGDDYPTPPEEPEGDPSSDECQAAMAQYSQDLATFEDAKADYEAVHDAPPEPAPVPGRPSPGAGMPAARIDAKGTP